MLIETVVWAAWASEKSLTPCRRPKAFFYSEYASYVCTDTEPVYVDWTPPPEVTEVAIENMAAFRKPLFYSLTAYREFEAKVPVSHRSKISPWTLPVLAALWSGIAHVPGVWWCWWDRYHVVCVIERNAIKYTPSTLGELAIAAVKKGLSQAVNTEL